MTTIRLKRLDLVEAVQIPTLQMSKVVNHVSPEGKKALIELDESRGLFKVTVEKQDVVWIPRENVAAFRELNEPAKAEPKK